MQVKNQFGVNMISQYDYTSDELTQRTSMTMTGQAFDSAPPSAISPYETSYTTNELNQYTSVISIQYSVDV